MKHIFYTLLLFSAALLSCEKQEAECARPDQCRLVPDAGPCMAAMPKYYYNPKTGRCDQFTWGGCAGVVPFQTLQECKDCGCETNKRLRL